MPIDFSGVDTEPQRKTGIDFSGTGGIDFAEAETAPSPDLTMPAVTAPDVTENPNVFTGNEPVDTGPMLSSAPPSAFLRPEVQSGGGFLDRVRNPNEPVIDTSSVLPWLHRGVHKAAKGVAYAGGLVTKGLKAAEELPLPSEMVASDESPMPALNRLDNYFQQLQDKIDKESETQGLNKPELEATTWPGQIVQGLTEFAPEMLITYPMSGGKTVGTLTEKGLSYIGEHFGPKILNLVKSELGKDITRFVGRRVTESASAATGAVPFAAVTGQPVDETVKGFATAAPFFGAAHEGVSKLGKIAFRSSLPAPFEQPVQPVIERARATNAATLEQSYQEHLKEAQGETVAPGEVASELPTSAIPLPDKYKINAIQADTARNMVAKGSPSVIKHLEDGVTAGKLTHDEARQIVNDGIGIAERQGRTVSKLLVDKIDQTLSAIEPGKAVSETHGNPAAAYLDSLPEAERQGIFASADQKKVAASRILEERKLGPYAEVPPVPVATPELPPPGPSIAEQAAPAPLEPWKMTRKEWFNAKDELRGNGAYSTMRGEVAPQVRADNIEKFNYGLKPKFDKELQDYQQVDHKDVIQKVLSEGKTVPENVLKDYPELKSSLTSRAKQEFEALGKATNAAGDRAKQGGLELGYPMQPDTEFRRKPSAPVEGAVTRTSDIGKFLSDKLDLPLRIGRFRGTGRGVLGIFKTKAEVVRSRFANDIETISHEIGHALQQHFGIKIRDLRPFSNELLPIATKARQQGKEINEGLAEFIRRYVTNEQQAKQVAPKFFDYWERKMASEPGIRDILHEARGKYEVYLSQPALQGVKSHISFEQPKAPRSFGEHMSDFYTNIFDKNNPLTQIVSKMGGKDLPASEHPGKILNLLAGVWGKVDSFLEHKTFDFNTYEWNGKSLQDILAPHKGNEENLSAFLVASRAKELRNRGIETGIPKEWTDKVVQEHSAELAGAAKELYDYQDRVLQYFRDAGLLDKDQYNAFKKLNENYVPYHRVMEQETGGGQGKGLAIVNPVKAIKGSWRDIVDPLESIIKNTYTMISAAEKNQVGRALVKLADSKQGMGKYVERIPESLQKITVKGSEVPVFAEDTALEGMFGDAGVTAEDFDIFRPSAFQPQKNVIAVWENGKKSLYQVHPDVARVFQSLDAESVNLLTKILSMPARLLRAGVTLTPEFSPRNILRDQWTAFINSDYGYTPDQFFAGVAHAIGKTDTYWKWKISGAEHSMLVSLDRPELKNTLKSIQAGKSLFNSERFKDMIKNPLDALRMLSEFGESGTRIGEFQGTLKKEGNTKAGIMEAGAASREISVDFAVQGAKTKAWSAITAFWNPSVQGLKRTATAFMEHPGRTLLRGTAAITIPSLILRAVNEDDGRWADVPTWKKDLGWVLMTGRVSKEQWKAMSAEEKAAFNKKNPIRWLPKPFEYGVMFGSIPERIYSWAVKDNPEAFKDITKTLGQFLPGFIPTAAVPIVENYANKSTFSDRPIVPKSREKASPENQVAPYTTSAAKGLGTLFNYSPAKTENLVRGWSGGLGMYALSAADKVGGVTGIVAKKHPPDYGALDIPVLKAFTLRYPASDAESIRTFYDNAAKAETMHVDLGLAIKERDKEKARSIGQDSLATMGGIKTMLGKLSEETQRIYSDKTLDPKAKRDQIDTIYFKMIDVATRGNEAFKKMESTLQEKKNATENSKLPFFKGRGQQKEVGAGSPVQP